MSKLPLFIAASLAVVWELALSIAGTVAMIIGAWRFFKYPAEQTAVAYFALAIFLLMRRDK